VRRAVVLLVASLPLLGLTSRGTHLPPGPVQSVLQFETPPLDDRRIARWPLTPSSVDELELRWKIDLPEIADSSPLYVAHVPMENNRLRNLLIVETSAGRVMAIEAISGEVVWQTAPPPGPRWTTSSPAVDPRGQFVFAYCLDGAVHKYGIEDGREFFGGGWPALITRKGDVEKGSSNITIAITDDEHTYLYMTIAAYPEPGDEGDYQGHLVAVDIDSGERRIFNALCSDREMIFDASGGAGDCPHTQAGIWARTAAVYDPETERLFVTVGNGTFDAAEGGFNWGSSVVALRPDGSTDAGTPLDSYTPENYPQLNDEDLDLSSTTIAILPVSRRLARLPRLGVQSGKDGLLRLLNLGNLSGAGGPRHLGGELQVISVPQGGAVMTQPEAWYDPVTRRTWLFIANHRGVSAFALEVRDGEPELVPMWMTRDVQGTTPVVANGMLFVATNYALRALDPATGAVLWQDETIGNIHWQSPIIVTRQVFIADHNAHLYSWLR
jgi:outer membrane protein assembly factor BamB